MSSGPEDAAREATVGDTVRQPEFERQLAEYRYRYLTCRGRQLPELKGDPPWLDALELRFDKASVALALSIMALLLALL